MLRLRRPYGRRLKERRNVLCVQRCSVLIALRLDDVTWNCAQRFPGPISYVTYIRYTGLVKADIIVLITTVILNFFGMT